MINFRNICIDLDLDRQLLPFACLTEIEAQVRETVEALATPAGGLCLKAEINYEVPLENIAALCAPLGKYRLARLG